MSDKDQVRPYHAKDRGSGQETADTLAQVLRHAAERDEAARQKQTPRAQPRWMLPLGINLGVLAVYLLIAPPAWVILDPIDPPAAEAQIVGLRTAIFLQAAQVEAYRQENGRLPERLEDAGVVAGVAAVGVEYFPRGGNGYQLVGTLAGETIVYDSAEPANQWAENLGLAAKVRGG